MLVTEVHVEPARKSPVLQWILGILLGIVLALIGVGAALWAFAGLSLYEVGGMLHGGQFHIRVDQPTVVRQVRALERLETASYTMDKIISGERENPVLPNFLAGDRLLLVAHGEVIAGVDLSQLQPADVQVHGRSVSIHLPPPEIFSTTLNNEKTRVYSRDTGLFTSPDPNLESEVRAEAERQLEAAARQDGILKTAETNARQTVDSLLASLGFESVEIR